MQRSPCAIVASMEGVCVCWNCLIWNEKGLGFIAGGKGSTLYQSDTGRDGNIAIGKGLKGMAVPGS